LPAHARKHSLLRPWHGKEVDARLPQLLDAIAGALSSPKLSQAAVLGVFALIGRLRSSAGALVGVELAHPLEQPTVIVEEAMHGVLTWPSVSELGRGDANILVRATRAAAITLDVPWAEVARAIWQAWDAAERPAEGADFLLPENDPDALFWAHIPRELLRPLLLDARDKPMPFEHLQGEPWSAIEEAVLEGDLPLTAELVRHAPEALLDSWLGRHGLELFDGPALGALFTRVPERLLRVLELHFQAPHPNETDQVLALLAQLPASQLEGAVAVATGKNLVRLPGPTLQATRKLLHRAVGAGGPVAQHAYAVLSELEEKLSAARRA
jgi:hypothetical protein